MVERWCGRKASSESRNARNSSLCVIDPAVARRAPTGVGLSDEAEPGIGKGFYHRAGIVMRSVIHDDDVEILKGLPQHRLKRSPKGRRTIIDRNDDAKKRIGHASHLGSLRPGSVPW